MVDHSQIPVLVIAFNRPEKLRVLLARLKDLGCKNVYFCVDGPRATKLEDSDSVRRVHDTINEFFRPQPTHTLYRGTNLGAKIAPPEGITWFFDQVEEGVILEDDCIPGDSFFSFMGWALERFRHEDTVKLVSGFNRFGEMPWAESFHYVKTAMIWGWATWRRAWRDYDPNFATWNDILVRRAFRRWVGAFPIFDFWRESIRLVKSGESWNWDIAWCWAVYSRQGLGILPRVSLIQNIGFGSDSTNTISDGNSDPRFLVRPATLEPPYVLPLALKPDLAFQRKIDRAEFWRTTNTISGWCIDRLRLLKRWVSRLVKVRNR